MNRTWGASGEIRKLNDGEPPSKPKPDFAFGFRVWISRVDVTQDGSVKVTRAKSNLSYQVLGELSRARSCELQAMPLKRKDDEDVRSNYLLGFPFAIVEVKRPNPDNSERQKCCLQAANAAATSLNIFEKLWDLAKHTRDADEDADTILPPVVSFTCIGPILRLWLCYSMKGTGDRLGHVRSKTSPCFRSLADTTKDHGPHLGRRSKHNLRHHSSTQDLRTAHKMGA